LLMPEEFGDTAPLDVVMHETRWGTGLVPASKALASAERALGEAGRGGASQRLKRGLERLDIDERFDLVLVDCPPGMTPLTMNALVAADSVLVPTQLDFLSVAGLAVLTDTVEEVREYDNPGLRYLGIVGTQVDERTRHAREIREQLERLFGERAGGALCRTTIRQSTRVRDAHAAGMAIGQFDPQHPVTTDYRALAEELAIRARLELAPGASR
jgi:chromosome partitioning protein